MITAADVIIEARTWLGTRWRHQASCKGTGVDCIGLIGGVALALKLPGAQEWMDDPSLHNYGRTPDPMLLLAGCERFLDRLPVGSADIGDVLVMAFEKDPQHFAIVSALDPTYIIHAYAQARKVVENGIAVAGSRVLRAYRYRGVI